jgi:hypothetical protein
MNDLLDFYKLKEIQFLNSLPKFDRSTLFSVPFYSAGLTWTSCTTDTELSSFSAFALKRSQIYACRFVEENCYLEIWRSSVLEETSTWSLYGTSPLDVKPAEITLSCTVDGCLILFPHPSQFYHVFSADSRSKACLYPWSKHESPRFIVSCTILELNTCLLLSSRSLWRSSDFQGWVQVPDIVGLFQDDDDGVFTSLVGTSSLLVVVTDRFCLKISKDVGITWEKVSLAALALPLSPQTCLGSLVRVDPGKILLLSKAGFFKITENDITSYGEKVIVPDDTKLLSDGDQLVLLRSGKKIWISSSSRQLLFRDMNFFTKVLREKLPAEIVQKIARFLTDEMVGNWKLD